MASAFKSDGANFHIFHVAHVTLNCAFKMLNFLRLVPCPEAHYLRLLDIDKHVTCKRVTVLSQSSPFKVKATEFCGLKTNRFILAKLLGLKPPAFNDDGFQSTKE